MMKCIYTVEEIHNKHKVSTWQEGITADNQIYPLIPTGFNATLDKRDGLYIVRAGINGETIAITNDTNTAIARARKADRRKPLAYVDEDGKLVVTDKDTENADLAKFAKVSPDFVYYVHYYNTKDLKLVAISYRSRDGFIKSKKPIVVEGVDKAKEKINRIAQKESLSDGAKKVVAWSISRKFAVDDDSDICNVPTVPDDVKKELSQAVKDKASRIRDERDEKENV